MTHESHPTKPAAVKNLFNPTQATDIQKRIRELHGDTQPLWGHMSVAQTLAHCTSGFEMAMGGIKPKRAPFPANVLGLLIKPLVFGNDKPMRRNSPSSPELFAAHEQCDFDRERSRLLAAIDRFTSNGAACCSHHPHPFFGPLQPKQWAILMYKHVDHHLRQFGV